MSASRPKDLDGVGRRLCDEESTTPQPDVGGLDELTITIVVDNATDTLSSIGPGVPQLPELASLLMNIPPTGHHDGHDCVVAFDHLCVACHGFSALATARLSRPVQLDEQLAGASQSRASSRFLARLNSRAPTALPAFG